MNPWGRWFERRRVERELAAEMAEHLAEKVERLRQEGHSEQEAALLARRQFGNVSLIEEDSRAAWGWNGIEQFWQDVRFASRVLWKAPGFSATAIAVLAVGIGMNTAMFSAVRAVLLSALPYPEPERMVQLNQTAEDGHLMNVSGLDFHDWRAQSRTIESMAAYGVDAVTLSGNFPARRARMAAVGGGFFHVLKTGAAMGRTFSAEEQKPGGPATLVIGYELAQAVFGTPAAAIQKNVRLNGMVFTVIGVMPPKFDFPQNAEIWLPNDLFPDSSGRSAHNYRIVGRVKPDVTLKQAQSDMDVVAARLSKEYADDHNEGIRVTSLYDVLTGGVRPALWILLGAVTMVLLIACVNISNLLLVRAAGRRKEMAMRRALGAGTGRLIRQLLTESVLLAAAGGATGLALAGMAARILQVSAPPGIPRLQDVTIDNGVLWFVAGLSLAAAMLFGILPSIESSRADVNECLKQKAGRGETRSQGRWSRLLVAGQTALAIVLLTGASLLIKSYWRLAHVETGLSSGGVYIADVTWPAAADGNSVDGSYVRQAGTQILTQIENLPGVKSAAFIHGLPFEGAPDGNFEIEGRPLPADRHLTPDADYTMVTPDYFRAFGLPIFKGRGFTGDDQRSTQQVAIVNESFGRKFFPSGGAVGGRIRFFGFDRKPEFMTIVGVVPDVLNEGLKQPVFPQVYADYFQHADTAMDASLVIRGPASLQPRIKRIVTLLDRDTAVNFESMDNLISGTVLRERFQTVLLGVFAASALLLAVVGVYGLLSYTVTQRTGEIGVRMALGASAGTITGDVLRQGGALAGTGIVVGLAGSLLVTRVLQSLLFQVSTTDAAVLFVATTGFAAATLAGCYLPARRASAIDPSEALRVE
ncbi:MAG: ABC transporter permease [Acidobacteriaceae bacterium]|nr:ABC transporter permease [Acidobacteriaceae bacterium]